MEEQGLAQFAGEFELRHEPLLLVGMGRVVAVEVQPAFANGHHTRIRQESAQGGQGIGSAMGCFMRVHPCRGVNTGVRLGKGQRSPAARDAGSRDHDRFDAGVPGYI